jgi:hypothetical protein
VQVLPMEAGGVVEEVAVARGGSMFGGRGRDRDAADAGPESIDAGASPAPSSARTILPGEPFEAAPASFPSQRPADPLMPSGWGMSGLPAPGDDLGATMFGPGGFGAHNSAGFPEPTTAPLPAMNPGGATGDPLDALQQYAGLPLSGFGATAPAPDPTQLYDPSRSFAAPETFGAAPAGGAEQTYGAVPSADAGPADAAPAGAAIADPTSTGPGVSAYGAPTSGFAAGGIFTGGDDFGAAGALEHAPFDPAAGGLAAAVGYAGAPAAGVPTEPATDAGVGPLPAAFASPLDVAPFGTARRHCST